MSLTNLKPFDSYFEEFMQWLEAHWGRIIRFKTKQKAVDYKIDFVVTNMQNGKQIAVECDGPTHFKDEINEEYGIYVEDDEERQRVLMAAGWRFYRIKYSDWKAGDNEKKVAIEELKLLVS